MHIGTVQMRLDSKTKSEEIDQFIADGHIEKHKRFSYGKEISFTKLCSCQERIA